MTKLELQHERDWIDLQKQVRDLERRWLAGDGAALADAGHLALVQGALNECLDLIRCQHRELVKYERRADELEAVLYV